LQVDIHLLALFTVHFTRAAATSALTCSL
jgi:hypothetical protein